MDNLACSSAPPPDNCEISNRFKSRPQDPQESNRTFANRSHDQEPMRRTTRYRIRTIAGSQRGASPRGRSQHLAETNGSPEVERRHPAGPVQPPSTAVGDPDHGDRRDPQGEARRISVPPPSPEADRTIRPKRSGDPSRRRSAAKVVRRSDLPFGVSEATRRDLDSIRRNPIRTRGVCRRSRSYRDRDRRPARPDHDRLRGVPAREGEAEPMPEHASPRRDPARNEDITGNGSLPGRKSLAHRESRNPLAGPKVNCGAPGRTRTNTPSPATDFESAASTISPLGPHGRAY